MPLQEVPLQQQATFKPLAAGQLSIAITVTAAAQVIVLLTGCMCAWSQAVCTVAMVECSCYVAHLLVKS